MALLGTDYVLANSEFAEFRERVKDDGDAYLLAFAKEREFGSFLLPNHVCLDSGARKSSSFPWRSLCHLYIIYTVYLKGVVGLFIAEIDNPTSRLVSQNIGRVGQFINMSSAIIASVVDHHYDKIIRRRPFNLYFYIFAFDLKPVFLLKVITNTVSAVNFLDLPYESVRIRRRLLFFLLSIRLLYDNLLLHLLIISLALGSACCLISLSNSFAFFLLSIRLIYSNLLLHLFLINVTRRGISFNDYVACRGYFTSH